MIKCCYRVRGTWDFSNEYCKCTFFAFLIIIVDQPTQQYSQLFIEKVFFFISTCLLNLRGPFRQYLVIFDEYHPQYLGTSLDNIFSIILINIAAKKRQIISMSFIANNFSHNFIYINLKTRRILVLNSYRFLFLLFTFIHLIIATYFIFYVEYILVVIVTFRLCSTKVYMR